MVNSSLQGAFVKIRKMHTWWADSLEKEASLGGLSSTLGYQPSTSTLAEILCEVTNAQVWMAALDKGWISTH